VNRDHLANPQTLQLNVCGCEESVPPGVLVNLADVLGRAGSRQAAGTSSPKRLSAKGTRAGLVAGIPPGKRSMTIEQPSWMHFWTQGR